MASELQEALDSLDMIDFFDHEGMEYRERTGSRGPQFNLHECPECGDSKWRVWMNQESGLGNCFHGDCTLGTFNKYSFIRAYLNNPPARDIVTYIKRIARSHGWRPKRKSTVAEKVVILSEGLMPSDCIQIPDSTGQNLSYLEDRGISSELAKEFGLRYCNGGYFRWSDPIGEREAFQYYGERVVIPVFDFSGNQVTFQGRDITGLADRKYLFPPGLPASGRYLYGANLCEGAKEVAVTEGVFDCWSVLDAFRRDTDLGNVGVVSTFGMHLSDDLSANDQVGCFISMKRLGLQRVTFMWDGEKRALKKAFEAAMRLKRIGLRVRVAMLPDGKDPNEATAKEIVNTYYNACDLDIPGQRGKLLRQLL